MTRWDGLRPALAGCFRDYDFTPPEAAGVNGKRSRTQTNDCNRDRHCQRGIRPRFEEVRGRRLHQRQRRDHATQSGPNGGERSEVARHQQNSARDLNQADRARRCLQIMPGRQITDSLSDEGASDGRPQKE